MEMAIAVGLGIWVAVSGVFSYRIWKKDFPSICEASKGEKEKA